MADRFICISRKDAVTQGLCEIGHDDEWRSVLVDLVTNEVAFEEGGQEEDMTLGRDLKVLVRLLNKVAAECRSDAARVMSERADRFESKWRAAKAEFGTAMTKMRARVRELEAEIAEMKAKP